MENLADIAVFVRVVERGVLMTPSCYVAPLRREHVPPKVRAFVEFLAQRFGCRPDREKLP